VGSGHHHPERACVIHKSHISTRPTISFYTFCIPTTDSFHKIYIRPSNVRGLDAMQRPLMATIPGAPVEGFEQRVEKEDFHADLEEGC
jgi:hypothetical protein